MLPHPARHRRHLPLREARSERAGEQGRRDRVHRQHLERGLGVRRAVDARTRGHPGIGDEQIEGLAPEPLGKALERGEVAHVEPLDAHPQPLQLRRVAPRGRDHLPPVGGILAGEF
jgi:hypothetical protein